jgi:plastocyanin
MLRAAALVLVLAVAAAPAAGAKQRRPVKVSVNEYEFGFILSRQTVPAGRVTFVMRNTGALIHNFDVIGGKIGPFLVPGQSATMTVTLKRGEYIYVCSVKYHAAQGMQGTLYVH